MRSRTASAPAWGRIRQPGQIPRTTATGAVGPTVYRPRKKLSSGDDVSSPLYGWNVQGYSIDSIGTQTNDNIDIKTANVRLFTLLDRYLFGFLTEIVQSMNE